jgi:hypothetical protein
MSLNTSSTFSPFNAETSIGTIPCDFAFAWASAKETTLFYAKSIL